MADIGTRGNVSPLDLDKGSKWQLGPDWLKSQFSKKLKLFKLILLKLRLLKLRLLMLRLLMLR